VDLTGPDGGQVSIVGKQSVVRPIPRPCNGRPVRFHRGLRRNRNDPRKGGESMKVKTNVKAGLSVVGDDMGGCG
jgi:hypothetical protein